MKTSQRQYAYFLVLPGLILIFVLNSLPAQTLLLFLLLLFTLISSRRGDILRFFSRFWLLILITLLVHLFLRFEGSGYWRAFGSKALWIPALFFTIRNINILLLMSYVLKNGTALSFRRISIFLEKQGPSFLAQPLLLAMRYSLLIREEFRSLQQVHRIMGIARPRRLPARVKYYIDLVFPTIIASLERAEHLSIAMTSRGYNKEIL
ncbi:MAG: energy-coupling factor transporter transmembrane component T [Candidatus Marinimicrobia bacterium]|jgi:energy-coupling factor transporter transmembrane protein EcfT|nr:energy-coupling factor transporter transmembrane component T [Candidatus Neomarinimicrobiota bacterium]MDD5710167.1 energy-coupling factor transporter transmembrane component T [Candidatus Neomarinimicrobiota bacterium]MDX9778216.1 energy-coupling factor transporter transmembrane component T [bacterium]